MIFLHFICIVKCLNCNVDFSTPQLHVIMKLKWKKELHTTHEHISYISAILLFICVPKKTEKTKINVPARKFNVNRLKSGKSGRPESKSIQYE